MLTIDFLFFGNFEERERTTKHEGHLLYKLDINYLFEDEIGSINLLVTKHLHQVVAIIHLEILSEVAFLQQFFFIIPSCNTWRLVI